LLFGDVAIQKYLKAIESEIGGKHIIIDQLQRRLEGVSRIDEEKSATEREQKQVLLQLEEAKEAIEDLKKFLADVSKTGESERTCRRVPSRAPRP